MNYVGAWKIWIDGSFVTNKMNPNDIDLVNILEFSGVLGKNNEKIKQFFADVAKTKYDVDAYLVFVYEENDNRFEDTFDSLLYWKDFFGSDKNNLPKGLIEINIENFLKS